MTTRREELLAHFDGPDHERCVFKILDQELYIEGLKREIARLHREVETLITDLVTISVRAQGVAEDARAIVGEKR